MRGIGRWGGRALGALAAYETAVDSLNFGYLIACRSDRDRLRGRQNGQGSRLPELGNRLLDLNGLVNRLHHPPPPPGQGPCPALLGDIDDLLKEINALADRIENMRDQLANLIQAIDCAHTSSSADSAAYSNAAQNLMNQIDLAMQELDNLMQILAAMIAEYTSGDCRHRRRQFAINT